MSKSEIKNRGLVNNSNQPQNQKPFDVQNNIKFLENTFGYYGRESLIDWVKEQPNFKGIIPLHFTPIVENQKQFDSFNFEVSDSGIVSFDDVKNIPVQLVEITTDKDCNITSVTMIITKNGKPYRVISKKDYGIIKSRYMIDSKGKFKNYEKCDLVLFDGEYKEYRINPKGWGDNKYGLNKLFNYKNGIKHGECKTYYKGEFPFHRVGSNDKEMLWYEMFSYVNGTKEGLYENTKFLERGYLKNGKRVGEWIVRHSDDIYIQNFTKRWSKNIRENETHRIKCNYMDNKLEGKWVGITIEEFFGIDDKTNIGKVGGEFKNGIMDGEFYSEFWNQQYLILRGSYKNNEIFGEWYGKSSQSKPITRYKIDDEIRKNLKKGKLWYHWEEGKEEEYLTSDEVRDYSIEISYYDGKSSKMRGRIIHKKETYKNNELISVRIDNEEDMRYTIELEKGINPFNEYTKDWIPNGYKNKGLSIVSYSGRKDGKLENKIIHFHIRENNLLGHFGNINTDILLNHGYPYTQIGKCNWDRRKKKTYPTLPHNVFDFYDMGKYLSTEYKDGERDLKLISIDGEVFEMESYSESNEYKSKRTEVINKIVKILSEERKKEIEEIKEKESTEFNLFPMD